jgi:hypothetical protein
MSRLCFDYEYINKVFYPLLQTKRIKTKTNIEILRLLIYIIFVIVIVSKCDNQIHRMVYIHKSVCKPIRLDIIPLQSYFFIVCLVKQQHPVTHKSKMIVKKNFGGSLNSHNFFVIILSTHICIGALRCVYLNFVTFVKTVTYQFLNKKSKERMYSLILSSRKILL